MLNTMIGASIFGLPSLLAARLGRQSPAAYLIAAAGVAVIAACLSEVASQFTEAGGPYLYAREAFGKFVAIQIGWLTWLSRISATSAVTNLFISYLGEFFPAVNSAGIRAAVICVLIGVLAAANYRGVSVGSTVSNLFTVTKVTLLSFFIISGFISLWLHPSLRVAPSAITTHPADWFESVILMVYAYGGFEAALVATGEVQNPRRDIPFALFSAIAVVTGLYIAVQYVVIHSLPDAAASVKPAVDAARRFLGPSGASIVAAGTLISAYGYLSANMLHAPRVTFAMGQGGDFPAIFAKVHRRFHTPYLSIVTFAALVLLFSIAGSFKWNAILSAVSRLFVYFSSAAALPVLRRKHPEADAFRLPAGMIFTVIALLFTGVLVTRMHSREILVVGITCGLALLNWLWTRRQNSTA